MRINVRAHQGWIRMDDQVYPQIIKYLLEKTLQLLDAPLSFQEDHRTPSAFQLSEKKQRWAAMISAGTFRFPQPFAAYLRA